MREKNRREILILEPFDISKERSVSQQTMGVAHVPLTIIKTNMEAVLRDVETIFENVVHILGKCQVEHVDLSLGLAVDGSIGIFGSKLGGEAKGGITVRLLLKSSDQI